MATSLDPAGYLEGWSDCHSDSTPLSGWMRSVGATPCIPNHLVWISFNWMDKCKEEERDGELRPLEALGADLSTYIPPVNLEGQKFSSGCVFVIVDKADVIGGTCAIDN